MGPSPSPGHRPTTGPPLAAVAGEVAPPAAAAAAGLAAGIGRAIEEFRGGRLGWSTLASMRREADALIASGRLDPASARALRSAAQRVPLQARTLGDDSGWDAVALLRDSIRDAHEGRIGHADLSRTLARIETSRERHERHWTAGARTHVSQLEDTARTQTLPLLSRRGDQAVRSLRDAQQAWERGADPAGLEALADAHASASALLHDDLTDPAVQPALQAAVREADAALQRARTGPLEAVRDRSPRAWREAHDPARQPAVMQRPPEVRSVRRAGGQREDTPAMIDAAAALVPPPVGAVRARDLEPARQSGPLRVARVEVRLPDGGRLWTRVHALETHLGEGRWAPRFEARGVFAADADGTRRVALPGRSHLLVGADGAPVATVAEAIAGAERGLRDGTIGAGSGARIDVGFESDRVRLPGGAAGLARAEPVALRRWLERVAPDAQRHLASGNALIRLQGPDLESYVGVTMNLAPNRPTATDDGPQSLYAGRAAAAIAPVADALRRIGGDAPRVRMVPVYLRTDDDRAIRVPLFRVLGDTGRERLVDHAGRIHPSFGAWKRGHAPGSADVFVPRGGRMQAVEGRVLLDAFDPRRPEDRATGPAPAAPPEPAAAPEAGAPDGRRDRSAPLAGATARGETGRRAARPASLADLLPLATNGGRSSADGPPGARAAVGARLLFWAAMFGVDPPRGAWSRFDLGALERAFAQGPAVQAPVSAARAPDVVTSAPGGAADVPGPAAVEPGPTSAATRPGWPATKQASADAARALFSDRGFANALHRAAVSLAWNDPVALRRLLDDPVAMQRLATAVAREQLLQRTFGGARVPPEVSDAFTRAADDWATSEGGPRPARLEQLAVSERLRGTLLRTVAVRHLAEGADVLAEPIARAVDRLDASGVRRLLTTADGRPPKAAIDLMRSALVAHWGRDAAFDPAAHARLDRAVGDRLRALPDTAAQRRAVLVLATDEAARRTMLHASAAPAAEPLAPAPVARPAPLITAAASPAPVTFTVAFDEGGTVTLRLTSPPPGRPDAAVARLAPQARATPAAPAAGAPADDRADRATLLALAKHVARATGRTVVVAGIPAVADRQAVPNATAPGERTNRAGWLPSLDPGSRYRATVEPDPVHGARVVWVAEAPARLGGIPAPAITVSVPEPTLQASPATAAAGPASPAPVTFTVAFDDDGTVTLRLTSPPPGRLDAAVADAPADDRARRAMPATPAAGAPADSRADRGTLLALADHVARATGRTVVVAGIPAVADRQAVPNATAPGDRANGTGRRSGMVVSSPPITASATPLADHTHRTGWLPPLDPGSHYRATVEADPMHGARVVWVAEAPARLGGIPAPAITVSVPEPTLRASPATATAAAGPASPVPVTFTVAFDDGGTVTLRLTSPPPGRPDAAAAELAPQARATPATPAAGAPADDRADRATLLALAKHVARATGRTVVVADLPGVREPAAGIARPAFDASGPLPVGAARRSGLDGTRPAPAITVDPASWLPPLKPGGHYRATVESDPMHGARVVWVEEPAARPGGTPTTGFVVTVPDPTLRAALPVPGPADPTRVTSAGTRDLRDVPAARLQPPGPRQVGGADAEGTAAAVGPAPGDLRMAVPGPRSGSSRPGHRTEGSAAQDAVVLASGASTPRVTVRVSDRPSEPSPTWEVMVADDGLPQRVAATVRPDWNGRAGDPGTATFAGPDAGVPKPLRNVSAGGHLPPPRDFDRAAAQAALDLGLGRLGQRALVGRTSDAAGAARYHGLDAPRQRVEFTTVGIDRRALIAAVGDGAGGARARSRPHLRAALASADPDAAVARLAELTRDALNARGPDGTLRPLAGRGADGAPRLAARLPDAAREVLSLPQGVVDYAFRITRPPVLSALNPHDALPAHWGETETLAATAPADRTRQPARSGRPDPLAAADDRVWRVEWSSAELAARIDAAIRLERGGIDPADWGLDLLAWRRTDPDRYEVAVRAVPGTPLSSLRLTPQQSRAVGAQLAHRIERLRAGGLHALPARAAQVRIDRDPDGTITATRLIDPAPFDLAHAPEWRADGDRLLGPLLQVDAAEPPPLVAAGPRLPTPGAASRPARRAAEAASPEAQPPTALAPSGAASDRDGTSPAPVYPAEARPLLQRALDPPDWQRAMQRLADAARAEGGWPAQTTVPGSAPPGAPAAPAAPPLAWAHGFGPGRPREPASVSRHAATKGGKAVTQANWAGDGASTSNGQAVAPITDSTTFEPMTRDALALRQWLEQHPGGHERRGGQHDADSDDGSDPEDEDRARAPRPQHEQPGDIGRKAG